MSDDRGPADEIGLLRQALWDVYRILGFDTEGDPTPGAFDSGDLVKMVVDAAGEQRQDYNDSCDELDRVLFGDDPPEVNARLRAAVERLRGLVEHRTTSERYTAICRPSAEEPGVWITEVKELPEVHSFGPTAAAALGNLADALGLWLEEDRRPHGAGTVTIEARYLVTLLGAASKDDATRTHSASLRCPLCAAMEAGYDALSVLFEEFGR